MTVIKYSQWHSAGDEPNKSFSMLLIDIGFFDLKTNELIGCVKLHINLGLLGLSP